MILSMEWAEIAFSWPFGKVSEDKNNVSLNRSHHVANLLASRRKISRDTSKLRTLSRGKSKRHSKEVAMPQQGSRVPTARSFSPVERFPSRRNERNSRKSSSIILPNGNFLSFLSFYWTKISLGKAAPPDKEVQIPPNPNTNFAASKPGRRMRWCQRARFALPVSLNGIIISLHPLSITDNLGYVF